MKHRLKALASYALDKQHMTSRTVNFAKLSMVVNAVIALGKIGMGIRSLSLFVCVSGLYNTGIALAKFFTVKGESEREQRKRYRQVGLIILAASLLYVVYCANMAIRGRANVTYDTITSITIATFTFAEIGIAAYGIGVAQKLNDLTIAAAKRINLVTALISVVLTQSALLGLENVENAARYCGWVGLIAGGVSALVGLLMVANVPRTETEL